jgi:hypothetical protein
VANAGDWQPARRDGIPPWWPAGPHLDHLADQPGRHEVVPMELIRGDAGAARHIDRADGAAASGRAGRWSRKAPGGWRRAHQAGASTRTRMATSEKKRAPVTQPRQYPAARAGFRCALCPAIPTEPGGRLVLLSTFQVTRPREILGGLLKVQGRHGCGGWGCSVTAQMLTKNNNKD